MYICSAWNEMQMWLNMHQMWMSSVNNCIDWLSYKNSSELWLGVIIHCLFYRDNKIAAPFVSILIKRLPTWEINMSVQRICKRRKIWWFEFTKTILVFDWRCYLTLLMIRYQLLTSHFPQCVWCSDSIVAASATNEVEVDSKNCLQFLFIVILQSLWRK